MWVIIVTTYKSQIRTDATKIGQGFRIAEVAGGYDLVDLAFGWDGRGVCVCVWLGGLVDERERADETYWFERC